VQIVGDPAVLAARQIALTALFQARTAFWYRVV
jgi:hypothetical protein